MIPKAIRRRQRITSEVLRRLGVRPANITSVGPQVALYLAGVKLSYAANLKKDLNRSKRRDMIGGFNCSKHDGTPIVAGCSIPVWKANHNRALSEALSYLEMAGAR